MSRDRCHRPPYRQRQWPNCQNSGFCDRWRISVSNHHIAIIDHIFSYGEENGQEQKLRETEWREKMSLEFRNEHREKTKKVLLMLEKSEKKKRVK